MITLSPTETAEPARQTASGQPGGSDAGAQTVATDERGLYVYGIVRSDPACRAESLGPIGLDQQEVYLVAEGGAGGLCAIVHDGPPTPYQSKDRPAVEAWIMAHQAVVLESARRFGGVLPMTFNMVVHGWEAGETATENLRAWLAENHGQFTDLLARLEGKAEYGVQIFWDRELVGRSIVETDPALQAIRGEIAGKAKDEKGLAYMLGQKLAKATCVAMEAWAQRTAGAFYEQIRRAVDDIRVTKPGKGKDKRQALLDLCCLMSTDATALGETLDVIGRTPGIAIRFTGPWPPYSFVNHT